MGKEENNKLVEFIKAKIMHAQHMQNKREVEMYQQVLNILENKD